MDVGVGGTYGGAGGYNGGGTMNGDCGGGGGSYSCNGGNGGTYGSVAGAGGSEIGGAGSPSIDYGGGPSVAESHIDYTHSGGGRVVTCAPDGSCPDGKKCYQITKEVGICDDLASATATECTPPGMLLEPDQCGCGGLTCPAGSWCRWAVQTCSCTTNKGNNVCVDNPCASPADCTGGSVCTPPSLMWDARCVMPVCHSDADCNAAEQGRCQVVIESPFQQGELQLYGTRCWYPGQP